MGRGPDPAWWREFVAQNWQRSPCLAPTAYSEAPPVDGDTLHAAAASATEAWLAGEFDVVPHLWSGAERLGRLGPVLLPDRADGGLQGWFDRVRPAHPQVMAYVREVHRHSRPLFEAVGALMAGLAGAVGGPLARVDADVFLGSYEDLGFGVHRDANDNFMVGVHGVRQLRLWPPDAFDAEVPLDRYLADSSALDAGSTIYEVAPGDLLYWPAGWWHIGHCRGGAPAATFNVNAWYSRSPLSMALGLAHDARKQLVHALTGRERRGVLGDPASPLDDLAGFMAMTAPSADEGVRLGWLARSTALGMSHPPPAAEVGPLLPDDLLGAGPLPVAHLILGDDAVAWSAGGHLDQGPDQGRAVFLDSLAGVLPATVDALLSTAPCGEQAAAEILTQLLSWGGLSRQAGVARAGSTRSGDL